MIKITFPLVLTVYFLNSVTSLVYSCDERTNLFNGCNKDFNERKEKQRASYDHSKWKECVKNFYDSLKWEEYVKDREEELKSMNKVTIKRNPNFKGNIDF